MKMLGYGLIVSSILATGLFANSPAWWKARKVMPNNYNESSETSIEENFEAAKIGQLMNIASKAAEELNNVLKDGAGDEINNLISSFESFDERKPNKNYQALRVSELKYVASVFYKRLLELPKTYVNFPQEIAIDFEAQTEDSVANVGQLKNTFAWSLTSVAIDDSDSDGLPDSWEMQYFGNLTTANGTSCYNGDGITDLQKYHEGKDPTLPPENSTLYLVVYSLLE